MDTNKKTREHISALSDGEIRDADQELALAALDAPDGRQAWDLYHHIGDILRAQATADLSPGFAGRLAARLAAEPAPGKRMATADAESGRPDAESTRADAGTARVHGDTARADSESGRADSETGRVDSETGRVDGSTASI